MSPSGIFISYRRDDSAGFAGRLFDRLADQFGRDRVFMDVDTIAPGHDFAADIESALAECDACVVLIGRNWLTIEDAEGRPRLEDPTDFVRLEVEAAVRRGITIFPVIVDRASPPSADALPPDMRSLAGRQAIELTNERWNYDVSRLVLSLESLVSASRPRRHAWHPVGIVALLLALSLVVVGALLITRATRGEPADAADPAGPTSPAIVGTYRVSMELRSFTNNLDANNTLWNEPDPQVGVSSRAWRGQTWIFTSGGGWRVEDKAGVDGALGQDGTYVDIGSTVCGSGPEDEAEVVRAFLPVYGEASAEPPGIIQGTVTVEWECSGSGPVQAAFHVEGKRVG